MVWFITQIVQFITSLHIQPENVIAVLLELTENGGHMHITSCVSRARSYKVLV